MLSTPSITLAVCTNFLPEAEIIVKRGELENVTLISWDATCQGAPITWDEMATLFNQSNRPTDQLVIIGSCFSRSLPSPPEALNHIHLEQLDHCFDLICAKEMVASLINEGSYLTSSGWLKSWRSTLADWGFDQNLARQFFQDTTNKIVLLDTGIIPNAVTELESFAAYVDLPCQHIRVGLDHFFWRLSALVSKVRGESLQQRLLLNEERLAQYEFSLSLLDSLTDSQTGQQAISGLVDIFHILFAPQQVHFYRHQPASGGTDPDTTTPEFLSADMLLRLNKNNYLLHDSQDGFWIVLKSGSLIAGYLNISKVQMVEYLNRYLNLALAIAPLCALTISRGRFAEQRQKDMKDLQQKNEEIEQFVNVVSHDLKSPLVTISSFLDMLQQDIVNNPELVAKDASFIRGAIDKMDQLLTALLQLARTGRSEVQPQRISLRSLIDSSLAAVAGSVRENGIDVVVEPHDLQLFGDPLQLGQIWQNLIENAIKYRGDGPEPRIVVGVDLSAGETEFFVCDNGIGIASKHSERIFGIFAQLNPHSGGCGLGLALVKKIVERYQGKIRVESEGPGQGSCFMFTLPGALKQKEVTE